MTLSIEFRLTNRKPFSFETEIMYATLISGGTDRAVTGLIMSSGRKACLAKQRSSKVQPCSGLNKGLPVPASLPACGLLPINQAPSPGELVVSSSSPQHGWSPPAWVFLTVSDYEY